MAPSCEVAEEEVWRRRRKQPNLSERQFFPEAKQGQETEEEIQFLGINWQDECREVPMDVINNNNNFISINKPVLS